ncbi:amidohydrolase family protein [Variovorax sp. RA8]|uniref:amidohydrolase family protein n=1 Tax=Variovorax sp. (strain JCM 16519 / RA8) TaxID=662548 RepID=UPI0013179CE6|nr:amidohydrolase family protein [Variovorax sp. RA8]VTU16537.1 putative metal-dependent hydrolase of the TIM-barrel fold protein [Variovorax sp. RA8]
MDGTLPSAIVDAHHHLWQLAEGRYPWLQEGYDAGAFFLGDYSALQADFGAEAYRARTGGLDIVATVHVEAERHRAESVAETRWLHAMHAKHGFPNALVVHVDLLAPDADAQLRQHLEWPLVRGVRCKPLTSPSATGSVRGQPGALQDARWHAGLALLAAHDLAWDLRVPFWHLEEAADAIARVPALRVVLEHAGLPWDRSETGLAHWRRGMTALAALPNVHVKLSEFGLPDAAWDASSTVRVIRETVAIFGWQRCMFASNLPVSGLRAPMSELARTVSEALAGLDAEARDAIWRGNALSFYRIDATGR